MVIVIALRIGTMVLFFAHVELAAQDGLDTLRLRRVKEVNRTIDIAVIGDRDGLLADRIHARDQLFYVAGAVQQ